ncbi:Ulp1 protease family carboxy-terminal domain protein, partial [Trifolium medium]|nr:Ulp1 protease family carboxy-terminal domain protein [Trifolium medium]
IFIPMNDCGVHWYLLVIDFIERKLFWLDSVQCLPFDERYHPKRHAILGVVLFLEKILIHSSFRELHITGADNLITDYPILQPRGLPIQRPGS